MIITIRTHRVAKALNIDKKPNFITNLYVHKDIPQKIKLVKTIRYVYYDLNGRLHKDSLKKKETFTDLTINLHGAIYVNKNGVQIYIQDVECKILKKH